MFAILATQFQQKIDATVRPWTEVLPLPRSLRHDFFPILQHRFWEECPFRFVIRPRFLEFEANRQLVLFAQSASLKMTNELDRAVASLQIPCSNQDTRELRSKLHEFIQNTSRKQIPRFPGIPHFAWKDEIIPVVKRRLRRAGLEKLKTPKYVKTAVRNAAKNALKFWVRFSYTFSTGGDISDEASERARRARLRMEEFLKGNGNQYPAEHYLARFAEDAKGTVRFIRREPVLRDRLAAGSPERLTVVVEAYLASMGDLERASEIIANNCSERYDIDDIERNIQTACRNRRCYR